MNAKEKIIPIIDVSSVRKPLETSRHGVPKIYSDPAIFELEKEKIFLQNWLMVGREQEIEKPGDYVAMRIAGEPIVLTRDSEGIIHAFANVCQHRGVEVAFGSGNTDHFMCPYHGWTYKLDGNLKGAPLSSDNTEFDRRNCKLPELALGRWAGNVYINFSKTPQPFEEFIAPYEKEFAYLHPERCRTGSRQVLELDCNWKLVVENLIDIYHVQVLHIGTFGKNFGAKAEDVKHGPDGEITYRYKVTPQTPDGVSLVGPMPWLVPEYDDSLGHTYRMPPNMHMFARIDMVEYVMIMPLSVNKSQLIVYDLFPADVVAAPGFKEKNKIYADFVREILEEDRTMTESLQLAMESSNYPTGPIVGMETGIHYVINDYLERMGFASKA